MTANQLVAYNLRRARELLGWTQERAAEALEPLLGRLWSKATFSAAETSVTSGRVREFSAQEILAFAAAFGVPVAFFFLPIDTDTTVNCGGDEELDAEGLLRAVAPAQHPDMQDRFAELGYVADLATDRIAAAVVPAVVQALRGELERQRLPQPGGLAAAAASGKPRTKRKEPRDG